MPAPDTAAIASTILKLGAIYGAVVRASAGCQSVGGSRKPALVDQSTLRGWVSFRQTMSYFFQGASGNDRPDSKTMRSLDSTPSGNPLTTYANIA